MNHQMNQKLIDAYIDTVKAAHKGNPSPALIPFTGENGREVKSETIRHLIAELYDTILAYNNELGRRN